MSEQSTALRSSPFSVEIQPTPDDIRVILRGVDDPEIPGLSVIDLGVIPAITVHDTRIIIALTPTFSGCPAIDYMQREIENTVKSAYPDYDVQVSVTFETAWNSNMITEAGLAVLRTRGFAPPPRHDGFFELDILLHVECPHCHSTHTVMQSPFGPTLCRSIHYCNTCLQAFEQFKPLA
jgi:ring-1,2-phenylacetyl-CoA epoxidase subunit PaaD